MAGNRQILLGGDAAHVVCGHGPELVLAAAQDLQGIGSSVCAAQG
ncbi:hypothetical protein [Mycobacterium leprae]|nr:hypothetical protein [Mycobacterium leprae]